jgi:glutathione S-transferase
VKPSPSCHDWQERPDEADKITDTVTLPGYRQSVYTRIAHLVLLEKGVAHAQVEVDPFSPGLPVGFPTLNPFGRVPVLCHGAFTLYETRAITRYIDAALPSPNLTPTPPRALARMEQVIAIIDHYGYWPLIRQVYANRVFAPRMNEPVDQAEAAPRPLAALEVIASEGFVLNDRSITLADCHLAPVIEHFAQAPEGDSLLSASPYLSRWCTRVRVRDTLRAIDPSPISTCA